eukprot:7696236-Lingulodinium_polyedra.AAC.1
MWNSRKSIGSANMVHKLQEAIYAGEVEDDDAPDRPPETFPPVVPVAEGGPELPEWGAGLDRWLAQVNVKRGR